MKHLFRSLCAALLLALPFATLAQTGVTIGATTAPDASAALDIISTSKGVLLPRVADATVIVSPATGLIVFQTGGTAGYYYNAGTPGSPNWQQLATAAGAAITASNGLTKTGQNIALGGTLTGNTAVALGGFNLGLTGGNVSIGTASSLTPLSVYPSSLGPKVTLWDAGSTTQHYGFGVSVDQLNYQVQGTASHVFSKQGKNNDGVEMMRLQGSTGNLGIGNNNPSQRLTVAGNALISGLAGTGTQLLQADASGLLGVAPSLFPASASLPTLTSTTTGLNNPLVAVSGSLAVVLNRGTNSLSLYDLTNPASPVLRGTLTDATNLANAVEVAISGTTAAVLCNTLNGNTGTGSGAANDIGLVRLFTLGATAPVLVNTLIPPAALSAVNGGLAMSGTKLYVVYDRGASTGYFYVYDVTTPATTSSTPQGTSGGAGGGFTPQSLAAAGNFVAIGSLYNGASILNVSNPAAPVVAGSTGFTGYTGGNDCPVALTATTLCVLHPTAPTLNTYTVSATGVPTLRNTYTTAATPVSVALNGNLALVACRVAGANVLQVIDVSGSTAVLRHTIALNATTNNVVTTPTLALVANGSTSNNLQIFNTPFGARTVVVGPDGALTSTPPAAGVDYVQNQTASAQTAGFNVSGNGTVGGTLSAATAAVSGTTTTANAVVTNALTGTGSSISGVGVGIRADGGLNLGQNTTGNSIYLGSGAGGGISGGSGRNTFLGFEAGLNGGTASNNNTFLGYRAGYNGGGGSFNLYLGGFSGYTNGGGSSNVFVGYNGGYHNTTGSKNTTLGDNSGPAPGSGTLTNATALGADVYLSQSNTVVLGNAADVGVRTATPTAALDVNGSTRLRGLTTAGLVTTDASGNLGSATAASFGTSFIQNQTATSQTGGFNLSGAGTVGGLLTAGSASVAGATSTASLAVTGLTAGSVPFVGSAGAVSQDNANLFFDNTNKRLGIGTAVPAKRLHVDAASDFLRVDNLASVSNTNNYLVIDNSGNVGKTTVENVAGQVIRLGFNGGNYFENTGNPAAAESALRFNNNATAVLMGNAPNGAANFINTVTGSSIALAAAVAAGNGTPARTTDQITLPAGVYRVTVRLSGSYFVNSASGTTRSGFVKFIVNNNEYSLVETLNAYDTGVTTHAEVSDYLNLNATSTVDFSVRFLRNFNLIDRLSPGTGNSYRSLLLIERVR